MSTQSETKLQAVIAHAKKYGFVFPSSEIYDGLSAVYDYGPYGCELKRNIRDYWWKEMTQMHENIVGLDASIFMHPTVWKASGHVDNFSDPMVDNKDSKKRYRVDTLMEDRAQQLREAGKETEADALLFQMNELLKKDDFSGLKELLLSSGIVCSISGTANWTDIRQFNLMFQTQLGSIENGTDTIYLRPETAQGIFVDYLNVQKTARMKIPFGIAQTGKAFRNEIVARQFIFRMREFEQMEMEFFVRPGTQKEWFEYWKKARLKWHLNLGIPETQYRFHEHEKLAHYADAAVDIEYNFPMGFKEVEGIHSRTDYDLRRHQEFSKKKITYFDTEINQSYIPYCIETSIGLDRMFLLILSQFFEQEKIDKDNGSEEIREVLHLPSILAPIKLAVLPLTKKDGLPEIARDLMNSCKPYFKCYYEEKDTIGKRYRRQDAIGTPFCVTIDHQTKDDQTVTIRYRDSMKQERILLSKVRDLVQESFVQS